MALIWTHAQRLNLPRPRRETMMLAAAGIMAGAFAYGHHVVQESRPSTADQIWAGRLAAAIPSAGGASEAMSSASLVVPKAQLALPPAPPKPKLHMKAICDSADTDCIPRAPAPVAAPRKIATVEDRVVVAAIEAPPRPPGLIPEPPKEGKPSKIGAASDRAPPGHRSIFASAGRSFAAIGQAVMNWTKSL
jgi:hypothetical protein